MASIATTFEAEVATTALTEENVVLVTGAMTVERQANLSGEDDSVAELEQVCEVDDNTLSIPRIRATTTRARELEEVVEGNEKTPAKPRARAGKTRAVTHGGGGSKTGDGTTGPRHAKKRAAADRDEVSLDGDSTCAPRATRKPRSGPRKSTATQSSNTMYPCEDSDAEATQPSPVAIASGTTKAATLGSQSSSPERPAKDNACKISDLSSGEKTTWQLKARVVARGPVSTWNNVWGGGQKFEIHLVDVDGNMVKAAVFNRGVDVFDEVIQKGVTYLFANGRVNKTKADYSADKIELSFDERAVIVRTTSIPQAKFTGPTIEKISEASAGVNVSTIGVVAMVDQLKRMTTKKQTTCVKREFLMVDSSMKKIVCTRWAKQAEEDISEFIGKVVVVKNAVLNEYQGMRSLNLTPSSTVLFEPDVREATTVEQWFSAGHDLSQFSFI